MQDIYNYIHTITLQTLDVLWNLSLKQYNYYIYFYRVLLLLLLLLLCSLLTTTYLKQKKNLRHIMLEPLRIYNMWYTKCYLARDICFVL